MRRWPQQYAPHFLFGLAEKKTGRARSKRKERLAQNLRMRAGLLKYDGLLNRFRLRQESLLPARAGLLSCVGLAPRMPTWQRPRGGCRKVCPSKFACALLSS